MSENLHGDQHVSSEKDCKQCVRRIAERNGERYLVTTGDRVESCTALIEYTDGPIVLIHHPFEDGESSCETAWAAEQAVRATSE